MVLLLCLWMYLALGYCSRGSLSGFELRMFIF